VGTHPELDWNDLEKLCVDLADGAFMATVQADGRPHVAWVGIGFGDERLWTATYASSQKARNLRHCQDVALHWPERPDRLIFMRAQARLVDDPVERAQRWEEQVLPYDQEQFYGTSDNPELLYVELVPLRASVQGHVRPVPQVPGLLGASIGRGPQAFVTEAETDPGQVRPAVGLDGSHEGTVGELDAELSQFVPCQV
jgi:general stress protein 26